jgi:hypothetical protein
MLSASPSLDRFAEAARAAMRDGCSFIARVTLAWCTIRLAIEEKLERCSRRAGSCWYGLPQVAAFV